MRFLISLLMLSGCATTEIAQTPEPVNVLRYQDGVPVIPAVVTNPAPVCEQHLAIARLDRAEGEQVYIDVESGGKVCKSEQ